MMDSYHILVLAIFFVAGYAVSIFLVKQGRLGLIVHRRFWNYLLLISFLLAGFLGLGLAFLIDYKLSIAWYRELLWYHVEFGISMALVAFFHTAWHWRYFIRKK